jgi:hypothetical protein
MFKNGVPIPESQDSDLKSRSNSPSKDGSETLDAIKGQENPFYKKYMSRLGDSGLHREVYSYLLFKHENLLEAEEVSGRYSRELPAED